MKAHIVTLIILVGLMAIHGTAIPIDSSNDTINDTIKTTSLTSSGPITINGDSDFSMYPGSGTKSDPYIIENYNITGSATAISISNTNSYYIVRNNYLNGQNSPADGIAISNSENGLITNNTVIYFGSTAINIQDGTTLIEVSDNDVSHASAGISMGQYQNTIVNNHIHEIDTLAIFAPQQGSHLVEGNVIHDIADFGIVVDQGVDTVIKNNTIYNCGTHGLGIFRDFSSSQNPTNNTAILANNITVNGRAAISINAPHSTISDNYIHGNNLPETEGVEVGEGSQNLILVNNTITKLTSGITFWTDQLASSSHQIVQNTIENMDFAGILLAPGGASLSSIEISENLIMNTDEGISDFGASSVTAYNNIIYNSRSFGIKFEMASQNSLVHENDIISSSGILATSHSEEVTFDLNYYSQADGSTYEIQGQGNRIDRNPHDYPNFMEIDTVLSNASEYSFNNHSQIHIDSNHYWTKNLTDITIFISVNDGNFEQIPVNLYLENLQLGQLDINSGDHVIFRIEVTSDLTTGASPVVYTFEYYYFNDSRTYNLVPMELLTPTQPLLNGTVTISWTDATDNFGLDFLYSVYVLKSGDSDWQLLVTELTATSWDWDTTKVDNGEYLLRIVVTSELGITKELVSSTLFTITNSVPETETSPRLSISWGSFIQSFYTMIGMYILIQYRKKDKK